MIKEDAIESILSRLSPHLAEDDIPSMRKDIERMLEDGWMVDEIVSYCRCTEEINPNLPKNVALAKMKKIMDRVYARVGNDPRKIFSNK